MLHRNKLVWFLSWFAVMAFFYASEMLAATVINNPEFHEPLIVFPVLGVVIVLLGSIGLIMWKAPWVRCSP
jgi:hypothetical protein